MRKLLLLALLLCKCTAFSKVGLDLNQQTDKNRRNYITDNIVALATRSNNYDYDDVDGNKRHSLIDDRRNWRKKVLVAPTELEHKDYELRKRHEYEQPRFFEEPEPKLFGGALERHREAELGNYRKRYEEMDKISTLKSGELGHAPSYLDEKKTSMSMNCDRPHERYESCFAGCAAISCDNPRERLRPCYPFCEPGCVCIPPYVRDDRTHKCILPDECTKGLRGIPDLGDDA